MLSHIKGDDEPLIIAGRAFRSRLMIGTGIFPSVRALRAAIFASGAEIVIKQAGVPVVVDVGLGASSYTPEQAWEAQTAGASSVNIGPIYPTQTKPTGIAALGPAALERTVPRLTIPFTVMGGIKAHNLGALLERGARPGRYAG